MMLGPYFRSAGLGLRSPTTRRLIAPKSNAPTLFFKRWRDMFRLPFSPELVFAKSYAEGNLVIEDGDVFDVCMQTYSVELDFPQVINWIMVPINLFYQGRTPAQSQSNVAAHYDLGNDLYNLFLDPDKQYSCAYFHDLNQDLATAQKQKKQHIITKLLPTSGMTALDIGCGWGGLSLDMAQAGLKVTGITLSEEQIAVAKTRGRAANLDIEFKLIDYRLENGRYDRVVSIGMFEHVGKAKFQEYFDQVSKNLKDDGIALIHTIGRPGPPTYVNRFITKYIFPGGYIPSLSQIATTVERSGLLMTDVECLYLHYAETLCHWRINFMKNRDAAVQMYDEHFARIWEIYLAGCEAAFRNKSLLIYQIQLGKSKTPVSLTREYMYKETD